MHPADASDVPGSEAPAGARVPAPREEPASPEAPAEAGAAPALTERETEILAFEKQWWKHAGAKEQAIRDRFGLSATRYYQLLNALLDNPAALAADPVVVGRLRRLRATRARTRRR
ncbi:DUF3263 domain-containing protein [Spirilliplanes yamanashiensis]|uniref:DUF3263 domain-containing protein n=1 Tax=Spirilliplanes yamanashiensis TaxID=42233 RepID=A0A8J3Y6A8_9ACTN|nr:DUF3263 domain-containing protein [Spirilliplanes yamanashiensis]MDP9814494.1 hypothetical protein [Spirilliplanes yamanashiensis]GIJ02147.1 hypothetical protein Sya03_14990 [Spirilliplanes yamanashiensis]